MDFTPYTKQFINGVWKEGTSSTVLTNYDCYTGAPLYQYHGASIDDVDEAFQAAKAAQPAWWATLPREKSDRLEALAQALIRRKDDLFEILRTEGGVVTAKCAGEFGGAINHIRQAMSFPYRMDGKIIPSDIPQTRMNYVYRKPKGVIAVIAPWNAPFLLAIRSVIPAVATGNAVVLRPSTQTPMSALFIAELFEEAGFPKGLVNVITGSSSEIGDAFVTHPNVDLVSFTGSTPVGQRIGELCGRNLVDVSLELGGNNTISVLPDADLDLAAQAIVWGSCYHTGQICMAVNRVIVHKSVYEQLLPKVVSYAKALKVGDPADPATFIGPMSSMHQVNAVNDLIQKTIAAGAKVALEGWTEGQAIHPWVLYDVTNDMPAAKNEVFGPVCTLMCADSEEEMLKIANDTHHGLSGGVFSKDLYHGMTYARKLETGMAFVNDQSINEESHILFGGEKKSGIGRFNGQWVVEKFTTEQRIGVQEAPRTYF